jgi:hypothetical protein
VSDNRSAHISKQTQAFLAALPNRFEFAFTSEHGSWLNLIESFSGTMARTLLRGIRVASAEELKARIELHLKEVNETPVVLRWKYGLETLPLAWLSICIDMHRSTRPCDSPPSTRPRLAAIFACRASSSEAEARPWRG